VDSSEIKKDNGDIWIEIRYFDSRKKGKPGLIEKTKSESEKEKEEESILTRLRVANMVTARLCLRDYPN